MDYGQAKDNGAGVMQGSYYVTIDDNRRHLDAINTRLVNVLIQLSDYFFGNDGPSGIPLEARPGACGRLTTSVEYTQCLMEQLELTALTLTRDKAEKVSVAQETVGFYKGLNKEGVISVSEGQQHK